MAQTAQQIVTGALKFLRILDAVEVPDADDSANALSHLNDYLNGLNARGAIFPNVTLALTDTVPIAQELEGDLKRALALQCQADWSADLKGGDLSMAMKADRRIVAAHTTVDPAGIDSGLTWMPGQTRGVRRG